MSVSFYRRRKRIPRTGDNESIDVCIMHNRLVSEDPTNHWNGKTAKTSRSMPILAIHSSTKSLQSTGKWGFRWLPAITRYKMAVTVEPFLLFWCPKKTIQPILWQKTETISVWAQLMITRDGTHRSRNGHRDS